MTLVRFNKRAFHGLTFVQSVKDRVAFILLIKIMPLNTNHLASLFLQKVFSSNCVFEQSAVGTVDSIGSVSVTSVE